MYSDIFCRVYNEFGWNVYPEVFAQQLMLWLREHGLRPESCLDLACGTGILCQLLWEQGIQTAGMDFSQGMIQIARENSPQIHYDVADMVTYRPQRQFDLVTCTGDALNHILELSDVEKIFRNVHSYLHTGGYFIFDLLNRREISESDPFEMDFSDTVRVWFQMTRPQEDQVNLCIRVWEEGRLTLEENILETVHDPAQVCAMLTRCGFQVVKCADRLPDTGEYHGNTWFVVAQKV